MTMTTRMADCLIEELKNKILDIKQLKSEAIKNRKSTMKLSKTAKYGNIVLINKKYLQFVGKRKNGIQEKVYIGNDREKEIFYTQALIDGVKYNELFSRYVDIDNELASLSNRISPSYI